MRTRQAMSCSPYGESGYIHVCLFSCVWDTFWTEHALIFQYRGYGGTSEWFIHKALYSTRLSLYANTNCLISPTGHFDRLSFKMNHYQNSSISASAAASYNITCGSEICGPPSKLLAYFALTPSRWLVYRDTRGSTRLRMVEGRQKVAVNPPTGHSMKPQLSRLTGVPPAGLKGLSVTVWQSCTGGRLLFVNVQQHRELL